MNEIYQIERYEMYRLKKTVRSYFRHMDKLADGDGWTKVNSDKWTARFEKLEAELKRLSK